MFSRLRTPILLIKQIERKKSYFSWKAISYIEASERIWTIQPSFRLCKPHFRFVDRVEHRQKQIFGCHFPHRDGVGALHAEFGFDNFQCTLNCGHRIIHVQTQNFLTELSLRLFELAKVCPLTFTQNPSFYTEKCLKLCVIAVCVVYVTTVTLSLHIINCNYASLCIHVEKRTCSVYLGGF